jgi:hypothetical protein
MTDPKPAHIADYVAHRQWPGGDVCVQCRNPWPCVAASEERDARRVEEGAPHAEKCNSVDCPCYREGRQEVAACAGMLEQFRAVLRMCAEAGREAGELLDG